VFIVGSRLQLIINEIINSFGATTAATAPNKGEIFIPDTARKKAEYFDARQESCVLLQA